LASASASLRKRLRVFGQRAWGQNLQGYVAVELFVTRPIDHAHPALADLFDDAIVRNCLADHGGEDRSWAGILSCARGQVNARRSVPTGSGWLAVKRLGHFKKHLFGAEQIGIQERLIRMGLRTATSQSFWRTSGLPGKRFFHQPTLNCSASHRASANDGKLTPPAKRNTHDGGSTGPLEYTESTWTYI
jgi:hypothetical protein